MRSVKLRGAPALSFGCPDPCKIDQNQFKFDYNSNKMRSAAFAVGATLVFLASRINEKLIKINSNSITFRIKCAQQPSRLKPPLCFWRPGSMKNWSKSIQIAQQPSRLKPPSYFWRPGEGFKGGGFGVCGRQDLNFKFKTKKITKWNLPKTLARTSKNHGF